MAEETPPVYRVMVCDADDVVRGSVSALGREGAPMEHFYACGDPAYVPLDNFIRTQQSELTGAFKMCNATGSSWVDVCLTSEGVEDVITIVFTCALLFAVAFGFRMMRMA